MKNYYGLQGQKVLEKTHLLQAAFHQCIRLANKSLYIPMREFEQLNPEVLDDLDKLDLICIDDIEFILGCQAWEIKLLDLYERLQTTSTRLLITSHETPKVLNFYLPDLASRFSMGVVHQLKILSEREIISAIQLHADIRGFNLPIESANYLLKRV